MTFMIEDFSYDEIKLKTGDLIKVIEDQNSLSLVETIHLNQILIPKNKIVSIVKAKKDLIPSFYKTLTLVAQEKIYLEMIEPPSLDEILKYQEKLIQKKLPAFYAVLENQVIGWCDITPFNNPRMTHRASLGMGILASYRSKKIGRHLLIETLKQAKKSNLEKVELHVYSNNINAITLYKNLGFKESGIIKHYRRFDNINYDAIAMELFLSDWNF